MDDVLAHRWRTEQNEISGPFQSKVLYYSMQMGRKQLNPKLMLSTTPPKHIGALKSQGFDINHAFMNVCRDHSVYVFIFSSISDFLGQEY